jgi:hypothetical protein
MAKMPNDPPDPKEQGTQGALPPPPPPAGKKAGKKKSSKGSGFQKWAKK